MTPPDTREWWIALYGEQPYAFSGDWDMAKWRASGDEVVRVVAASRLAEVEKERDAYRLALEIISDPTQEPIILTGPVGELRNTAYSMFSNAKGALNPEIREWVMSMHRPKEAPDAAQ